MVRRLTILAAVAAATLLTSCQAATPSIELLRTFSHQTDAFTQGLVYSDGRLFESTGLYGRSSLRELDPLTGEVIRQLDLDARYFGEGLELVGTELVMLTWQEGEALVFDRDTFEHTATFAYEGQGWGLCHDGNRLIMSDGSATLQYRDSTTFELLDTVTVTYNGNPLRNLNELECVQGNVYANVWLTTYIVRIGEGGVISAVYDLQNLLSASEWAELGPDAVLNGIAWIEESQSFLITGKLWPKMFEVRLN